MPQVIVQTMAIILGLLPLLGTRLLAAANDVGRREDSVFALSATSQRHGLGPDDELSTDLNRFVRDVLIDKSGNVDDENNAGIVLYLDASWALYGPRGWTALQELYGNLTAQVQSVADDNATTTKYGQPLLPMPQIYVYNYHNWFPENEWFRAWWESHKKARCPA